MDSRAASQCLHFYKRPPVQIRFLLPTNYTVAVLQESFFHTKHILKHLYLHIISYIHVQRKVFLMAKKFAFYVHVCNITDQILSTESDNYAKVYINIMTVCCNYKTFYNDKGKINIFLCKIIKFKHNNEFLFEWGHSVYL